jgi:hypothetical protein
MSSFNSQKNCNSNQLHGKDFLKTLSYSHGQEITRFKEPKAHRRNHNSPSLGTILSQFNPVFTPYFFIFPMMHDSPKRHLPSGFPNNMNFVFPTYLPHDSQI